jgi:ribosomal protein S18 acetylase RimI-like enzyme
MIIRTATAGDTASVLALWASSRSEHASTPDTVDALKSLMSRQPDALLVAEIDAQIVGALIAAWDGWRGNMYRLVVSPTMRRRGIAKALVHAGQGVLARHGAIRITALVAREDPRARGLWESCGYDEDGVHGRFVTNLTSERASEP